MIRFVLTTFFLAAFLSTSASADQDLVCARTGTAPSVDGDGSDAAWSKAEGLVTRDLVANLDMHLQCVHSGAKVFFLVSFADDAENRLHKTLQWDPDQLRYRTGPNREDTFVFKWSMEPGDVDLSLSSAQSYKADIWYWKADRTDPVGYADDKSHTYSSSPLPRATKLVSKDGRRFYLVRPGDEGDAAYLIHVRSRFEGESVRRYDNQQPSGSRSDIRAKGQWRNGVWFVEFARALVTDHADDVQFDFAKRYQFGVSRHEVAGRPRDPQIDIPMFGAGEVGEPLTLSFER
jgi:hypothetical protein